MPDDGVVGAHGWEGGHVRHSMALSLTPTLSPHAGRGTRSPPALTGPMLSINNIEVVYDNVILVLKGVSLEVKAGAITTLLGANGAGKTTTLKAISGVLRTERGNVTKGSITLGDKRIDGMRPFDVTRIGISQVFEGRRVFEHLTTEENLVAGGHVQRERARSAAASSASIPTSRCSRSGAISCRATSPAASSRCWRSAAR